MEAYVSYEEFRKEYDESYLPKRPSHRKNKPDRPSLKEEGEPDRGEEFWEIYKRAYEEFREILFPSYSHEDLFTSGDESYEY